MGPSFGDYVVYAANYVFRPAALTVDMNSDPSAAKDDLDRAEALARARVDLLATAPRVASPLRGGARACKVTT